MKNNLWNILKKELREMFRDKKSLSMMLVIPIFVPLIVLGMSALFEVQANKDIEEYNKIGFAYELSEEEKNIAKELNIEVTEGNENELKTKYENDEIDLYITKDGNKYIINGNDSDVTTYAKTLMESYFNVYKEYLQSGYLQENNINPNDVLNIITVEENITEEENMFVSYIRNYAFVFIIMAITVSATYPATDTTAGERERGTLETLLTFPIKSRDIIVGKFLAVTIASILTGIISLVLAIISVAIAQNAFSIYEGLNIMFSPISILLSVIIIIAYSFFISGLCIAIASSSKTFKEAQSALTPLTFISLFPGMIAFMIGVTGTPLLSIIPFINYVVVFTDTSAGNVDWLNIALMVISTIIYISIVLTYIIKQYKSEKILFSKE
jgi:putative sodium extrusion ABC transporter,permease protein